MFTNEGKKLDPSHPLEEYPTPQFQRDSYFCLNGEWDFQLDEDKNNHSNYTQKIIVPFAVETPLSQVERPVKKGQIMHYRKTFRLPFGFRKGRVLLHFEAVDQVCDVYLNGVKIAHHEGGYLPFTVDCLELRQGDNELLVDVTDDTTSPDFPRGKQATKSSGIWYTSTSGIWGTVWLESVPNEVIQSLRITPLFDEKKVHVVARFEGKILRSKVEVFYGSRLVATATLDDDASCTIDLSRAFHPWSPDVPDLYDLRVSINFDVINSYFAMRKFSSTMRNGYRVFALNNEPLFLTGVLDQGYYPDGGLTPPSEAAMINDVRMLKNLGFNMVRKHIKIEPMRWYYHCDRLGLIVIQDFVNGGAPVKKSLFMLAPFFNLKIDDVAQSAKLGRQSSEGKKRFEEDMGPTVERLFNVPSIAIWTLFNEGWGQFDSIRLTEKLRALDPTRLIDSCSGWFDQGAGDFESHHRYFFKPKYVGDGKRILSLSEFGAYSHVVEGHCDTKKRTLYSYYRDIRKLRKAISSLYRKQIAPLVDKGLSVAVYTQLSDVEQETNGLITYDRKVIKVDGKEMRELNGLLSFKETSHG